MLTRKNGRCMADLPRRKRIEADLAAKIATLYGKSADDLIKILRSGATRVDDAFWQEFRKRLERVLGFELEDISMLGAGAASDEVGLVVDWDLINQRAADWARQYTIDLARRVTDTKQTLLRNTIADFYEQRLDLGQVKKRLLREFGAVRAELMAVTETTRAAVEGEHLFVEDMRSKGVQLQAFWVTNEDARVCKQCSPLDGKPQGTIWTKRPPLHGKCRCWLRYEVVLPEGAKADFRRTLVPLDQVRAVKSQSLTNLSAAGMAMTLDVIERQELGVGRMGLWAQWASRMGFEWRTT